jgi:transposase-like protein
MDTRKTHNTSGVERHRKYTDEFKRDAVSRVLRTGKSCTRVGEELGINPNMLARWRREQIGEMDKASSPEESLKPSEMAEMLAWGLRGQTIGSAVASVDEYISRFLQLLGTCG